MNRVCWELEKTAEDVLNRLRLPFYKSDGANWIEDLKISKDNPQRRYEIALENLPLPAAFSEAVTALRLIIKQQIKQDQDYLPNLNRLYEIAVWHSFCLYGFSHIANCTEYSIFERMIGSKVTSLNADYQDIGYKKITLLKKTDIKLLVQNYGEPNNHQTLNDMYRNIWLEEENNFNRKWRPADANNIELFYGYQIKEHENGGFTISARSEI